jgi:hypothetical protein
MKSQFVSSQIAGRSFRAVARILSRARPRTPTGSCPVFILVFLAGLVFICRSPLSQGRESWGRKWAEPRRWLSPTAVALDSPLAEEVNRWRTPERGARARSGIVVRRFFSDGSPWSPRSWVPPCRSFRQATTVSRRRYQVASPAGLVRFFFAGGAITVCPLFIIFVLRRSLCAFLSWISKIAPGSGLICCF